MGLEAGDWVVVRVVRFVGEAIFAGVVFTEGFFLTPILSIWQTYLSACECEWNKGEVGGVGQGVEQQVRGENEDRGKR